VAKSGRTSGARGFTLAPAHRHELLGPDAALAKLRTGADRLAHGDRLSRKGRTRLAALAKQQQPFAVLVGCSDSRVAPELIFGCGLGDLFVVRQAGNTVGERGLGSIVYGVEVLGAALIVVLGHARCGAVEAATRLAEDPAAFSGALKAAVEPIVPAVLKAKAADPADLVAAAVHENVRSIVDRIARSGEPAIADRLKDGRLKIIGAYYDLVTGEVEFLD
jgi:carbonic anhydrase